MLYSGELSTLVDIAADIAKLEDEEVVEVERTRDIVSKRTARSFMIEGAMAVLESCGCPKWERLFAEGVKLDWTLIQTCFQLS
jgi:hypothetical protein